MKKIFIVFVFLLISLFLSPHVSLASTDFTFTSSTSALGAGTPSRAFSLTLSNESLGSSAASFTLSDNNAGGTFFPSATVSIPAHSSVSANTQFIYLPSTNATGTITINVVASGGMQGSHSLSLPIGNATKFIEDTFNDTSGINITNHIPDIGAKWIKADTEGGNIQKLINEAGGLYDAGTGHAYASWIIPAAPLSSEHDVVATFSNINNTSTIPDISTFIANANNLTGYRYAMYQGSYVLLKYIQNAGTVLFASDPVVQNGSTHTLRLAVRNLNGAQYLFPMSDGVLVHAPIQDGALTSGYAGQIGELPPDQTPLSTDSVASHFIGFNTDWAFLSTTTPPTLPPETKKITITDSNIVWSPYNWRFEGSTYAQTTVHGAYVKIAFSGPTLALGIDTSANNGLDLSTTHLHTFIDGTSTPIDSNLSQLSQGTLKITSSLSSGNHYALIYLSAIDELKERWNNPVASLRITNIQVAGDSAGSILSLSSTPLAKKDEKILLYGDSITEGGGTSAGEKAYSALIGQRLGVEYGQIGYGSLGWGYEGNGHVPQFYDLGTPTNSVWRKFDADHSRLVDSSNVSSGFIDGIPNAVFINMGINDANVNSGSQAMRTKVASWISDVRQTIGQQSAIFVIVPFNYGNENNAIYAEYKTALLNGVQDYKTNHSNDVRVYTIDLGTFAYNTVVANSSDGLHPNDNGADILANQILQLAQPYIAPPLTSISANAVFTWTTDASSTSMVEYGLSSNYGSSTPESDAGSLSATTNLSYGMTPFVSSLVTNHSVTISGLQVCTPYHYRVRSRDISLSALNSPDATFISAGCEVK